MGNRTMIFRRVQQFETFMLRSDRPGSRLEACDGILRDGALRLLRVRQGTFKR